MNALAPTRAVHQVSTAEGTVLLDADHGCFYGLNPTATAIWQALSHGRSVEQITRDLTARFTAPPERIRTDVTTLVAQFRERGLVATTGQLA